MSKTTLTDAEADQLESDITSLNDKYGDNEIVKQNGNVGCILDRTGRLITDPEFDRMVARLTELRPDAEVLSELTGAEGEDVQGVPKVTHNPPMASISKAVGKLDKKNAE